MTGKERAVAWLTGKAMGPWTLSFHLYGVENTLANTAPEKEKLHKAISKFTEITKTFGQAQFDYRVYLQSA